MDIIITIPKKIKWSEYQKELLEAEKGGVLNYKVRTFPNVNIGDKCYLCYNGSIIGYHFISGTSEKEFKCTVTGKVWKGKFVERTGKFHRVAPEPMNGFRGFRYKK